MPSAAWLVSTGLSFGVVHVVTGLDHLGAIATLAAANSWKAFFFGIKWGCGHSTAIILLTVIFLAVGQSVDLDKIGGYFDWAVGVTMIVLGLYSAWLARRMHRRPHEHFHGGVHDHPPSAFFHARLPHLLSLKSSGSKGSSGSGSGSGHCLSAGAEEKVQPTPLPHLVSLKGSSGQRLAAGAEETPQRTSLPRPQQHQPYGHGAEATAPTAAAAAAGEGITVARAAALADVEEAGAASAEDGAEYPLSSETEGFGASRRPSCDALLAPAATEATDAQETTPQRLFPGDIELAATAPAGMTGSRVAAGSPPQTRRRKTWKGVVAFGVGLVHGLSGTGGALGVLPAVALADWGQSMLYISMFSASSILTMGCLAAGWGVLTDKVTALRGPSGAARLRFCITVTTSVVCVLIGVLWLVLTGMGLMGIFG